MPHRGRVGTLEDYTGPKTASAQPGGTQEDSFGTLTRKDLGKNIVDGLDAVGTRETRTPNPGAIANDRPISIIKEFWYAPQLGSNLSVKRIDPRHSTEIFNVPDISLAEPDPKYFVVPAGFSIVDHRSKTGERAQTASASTGRRSKPRPRNLAYSTANGCRLTVPEASVPPE